MVRTETKSDKAKKSTQNNKSSKKFEIKKKSAPEIKSVRITRSKSLQTEITRKVAKIPEPTVKKTPVVQNTLNTRSKSQANFLSHNTRSKSIKIENITIHTVSNEQQAQSLDDKKKSQTKSLSLSKITFVKLNDFKVDSIVLAKQKYSVPWPAKVIKIEKKRVFVYFFGDRRCGFVSTDEIYDFILSGSAIKSIIASKKQQRSYFTGIREVEFLLGITSDNSSLN